MRTRPSPAITPHRAGDDGPAHPASAGQMSNEEITAIVNAITSLITVLRDADPHDKAEIYSQLGLRLTYNPSPRTVSARAEPGRPCTKGSCPRGDLNPHFPVGIRIHLVPIRWPLSRPAAS